MKWFFALNGYASNFDSYGDLLRMPALGAAKRAVDLGPRISARAFGSVAARPQGQPEEA